MYVIAAALAAFAAIFAADAVASAPGDAGGGGGGDSWPDADCNVSFDSQGGSSVYSIERVPEGSRISEPAPPSLDGYAFGGWYREEDCVNRWNFASDTVYGDITLYAKWDFIGGSSSTTYHVRFNSQGGSPVSSVFGIMWGGRILEPPAPEKRGFVFGGWYTEDDCVNAWDFDRDSVRGNTMLYAKWTSQYMLSLDGRGAEWR
ncbi:MAG: InlB B-repeat-containing protein [Candidatus Methanoplasma sp.]|nr:InlB B-repeat-containing protein [Candidatus Methanoplasma sp.]